MSLPVEYLCGAPGAESRVYQEAFGPAGEGLAHLRQAGVTSIELHHFSAQTPVPSVARAAAAVVRAGMQISIHGYLVEQGEGGLDGSYPWLPAVAESVRGLQERLVITVHALAMESGSVDNLRERTVRLLGDLARLAPGRDLPLLFALELNRDRGAADPSTTWESVESMCREIGRPNVGICWDWGHGYANALRGKSTLEPPARFLDRVVNTHIHGISPAGSTHWPLDAKGMPVERFVPLLRSSGYPGSFVLELNPLRFVELGPPAPQIEKSLERLRAAIAS
jgi:sugar phosphate isomerase/epimerase